METINIIFSSDNNYAQHLGVCLCSIFENKKNGYLIDVYVIDGDISEFNKNKLRVLEVKYSFKIKYIKINKEDFLNFPTSEHVSIAAYFRILIPNLLPNLKKILYLDCDIVVMGDLFDLYNIKIDDFCISAVEDVDQNSLFVKNVKNNLGIKEDENYFNSGVLLINLEKWRENNITQKGITFIKNNPEKIIIYDQDALNYFLHNDCLFIGPIYNTQLKEFTIIKKDPVILHLTSSNKPWNYNYINKYGKRIYFNYLKKTPWKDFYYKDFNLINFLKKNYKIIKKYLNLYENTI